LFAFTWRGRTKKKTGGPRAGPPVVFDSFARLGIVGIPVAVFVRPEIDVRDLTDPLDVHDLAHRLSTRGDRDHIIAWVDEIPHPSTAEETATAFATPGSASTDWGFRGPEVDFSRRAATLSAPSSASESTTGLHPFSQRSHPGSVAARAHCSHAVAHRRNCRGVGAGRNLAR
jgi:hypothetical protein